MTKQEKMDEAKRLMDHYGIKCNKCFDRGYLGWDTETEKLILCKCLEREIKDEIKT